MSSSRPGEGLTHRAHRCRRVCEVQLHGKHQFSIKQQKYKVSDELKEGQARILFGQSSRAASHEHS